MGKQLLHFLHPYKKIRNAPCGQNVEFFNFKILGTYSSATTELCKVNPINKLTRSGHRYDICFVIEFGLKAGKGL
jgi:hypothetical protein